MAEIGRWNGHKFEIAPDVIRGFTGLTIKGSSETEDKKKDKQKYVSRKNGKPTEVNITVILNQMMNVDVRTEALAFVEEALSGAADYFYVGSKKLVNCKLMLTDAQVKDMTITNGDTWLNADVQLTMKQAGKYGGIDGGGTKKKRKKKSTKKGGKTPPKGKTPPHFADHNELTKLTDWKTQTKKEAEKQTTWIGKTAKAMTQKMLSNQAASKYFRQRPKGM